MVATTTDDNYKSRLNKVYLYIQENLDKPLQLKELADIAMMSAFHFHRIFRAYNGESLNAYLRRIRLENAAKKLIFSTQDITRIALDAAYETPAAFGKAFKQAFSLSPSEYRKRNRVLEFEKQSVQPKENANMKTSLIHIDPIDILYVRKTGSYSDAANQAWSTMMPFAYKNRLMKKDTRLIGIAYDSPEITSNERLRYDACISVSEQVSEVNLEKGEVGRKTISAGKYARFLHQGAYAGLSATYNEIFASWFPDSGEELRDEPCFEIYLNRDARRILPKNLKTEIYVPLQ